MRITTLTSISAALVCGSLLLGATGPALATGGRAAPPVVEPAPGAGSRADSIGSLGETLSLGSRVVREAQSRAPDLDHLRDLRLRLRESADRLLAEMREKAAEGRLRPPEDGRSSDPVSDVKQQLDTLVKDVTDLLAAVQAKDTAKITALITKVVADLQALLASVPKLLTGAAPVPLPVPLPV